MASGRKESLNDDRYVSLYGAADLLGIATKTVLARIVAGDLEGEKIAGRIVVTRVSVEKLAKEQKAGAA